MTPTTHLSPGLYIKRGRAYVRIFTGWVKRARAVWVMHHGPIPKGRVIHHRDEDKLNDDLENLRCWTGSQHMGHHGATNGGGGRVKS